MSAPESPESQVSSTPLGWEAREVLAALDEANLGVFATEAEVMALAQRWGVAPKFSGVRPYD